MCPKVHQQTKWIEKIVSHNNVFKMTAHIDFVYFIDHLKFIAFKLKKEVKKCNLVLKMVIK